MSIDRRPTDTYRAARARARHMLRCPACGTTAEDRWRCDCGHPMELADSRLPTGRPTLDSAAGLWSFESLVPVERRVSLGEGLTPLVAAPAWDATVKLEWFSPTGSFKDRGATVLLSRAASLGVDRVLEDSSGNAGLAVATYAARAGIDAEIYVPATADPGRIRAIERTGADVSRVEGSRADVAAACIEAVETGDGWYASHAWRPTFLAGTATFAFEVAAQRGWTVPDALVCPVGHGTLLLGAYRGFRSLHEAGVTDRVPRLVAAQAAGAAPVVAALSGADAAAGDNALAAGVRIREPVRLGAIVDALEATDGVAVAVGRAATERAGDRLRRSGFDVAPTAALGPAALEACRDRGLLEPDADVVVPLTGARRDG